MRWKQRPTVATTAAIVANAKANTTSAISAAYVPSDDANPNSPDKSAEVVEPLATEEKNDDENDDIIGSSVARWCILSRGQVDATPIVKLISEGVGEPAFTYASSSSSN